MSSPILWGPNSISNSLQQQLLLSNGKLIADSGPYNLIPYAQFENGLTTGWGLGTATLTSNFPSGAPTFGSGASGNLTLSATSSNPILGAYSLSLASSAATTAGNFVASDQFSIPLEMQGKVISFKFAYNAAANASNGNFSGTSSNSFGVAFWDATNSAWIMPAGVFNLVQSSGVGIATGTVQPPTTCLAGRLVIYNANATSGAITMVYDDFYVGLQTTSIGPAMSDWTNTLTFTPSAGFGTTTNSSIWSRRDGDMMTVRGTFKMGSLSAVDAYITLPVSIDTTKITAVANVQPVGRLWRMLTASTNLPSVGTFLPIYWDGTNANRVYISSNTASFVFTGQTVNNVFATNDVVGFEFQIPVSGWSSNTAQSADTSTRVIAARATCSTATTISTATVIPFDAATYDLAGGFSGLGTSSARYTAPVTGRYKVNVGFLSASSTTAQRMYWEIFKNNVSYSIPANCNKETTNSGRMGANGGDEITLNAGDFIDIRGTCTGASTNLAADTSTTFITIELLSGPAVVQATDSVNCRYYASATSLSGSLATINWTTKDYDSHNAMSSGTYTVPAAGKYHVAAALALSGTFILNNTTIIEIQKNGTAVSNLTRYIAAAVTNDGVDIEDTISCNAGDTIRIQVSNSGTGPAIVSSNTRNFISIFRTGN
jgi:uncharacterized membrane protein